MSRFRRRVDLACGALVLAGLALWARWGGVEGPSRGNARRASRVPPQADVVTPP